MKITLDEKHRLNSDGSSFWITELSEKLDKDGNPYETRASGYFSTIQRAISSYVDNCIISSKATSITALLDELRDIKERVMSWDITLTDKS